MKSLLFVAGLCIALFQNKEIKNAGTIAGIIINEEGKYLQATINISSNDTDVAHIETDLEGNYRTVLEAGVYTLEILAPGYEKTTLHNIEIERDIELETHACLASKQLVAH